MSVREHTRKLPYGQQPCAVRSSLSQWTTSDTARRPSLRLPGSPPYRRWVMAEQSTKAQRRADREAVGAYHEAEPARLLEHVRVGFARYGAGEIEAFELDELVHHYKRATQKLWSACVGGGGHVEGMARRIEWEAAHGEQTDWSALAEPRRRR
jgi:hypothetical protein